MPQLTLDRLQGGHIPSASPHCGRLDVNTEGRAAVCDARGVLHQLLLEDGKVRLLAQYQLHYGTELRMQAGGDPVEVPCPVLRPWTHFDFVPNRLGALLLHQAGSSKLLYTQLPGRDDPTGSPVFHFGQHADAITCCKVSRAGRHAASGGVNGELKLWGLAEGLQLDRQQHAHAGPVTVVAFLEPAVVLSGGQDGAVCVWEVQQQRLLARQSIAAAQVPICCLAGFQPSDVLQSEVLASRRSLPWQPLATGLPASHHQVLVAAGTATGSVLVWQAAGQGEHTWQLCCQGHQAADNPVQSMSFSPDGSVLAATSGFDVGHLWVYNTGDWGCRRMPGALAAPPRDCVFCDWVDIAHEPVLFLAGGGGDGTASLLQIIPSQLQGSPAAQAPAPPFLRYVDPVDAEESCPQPSSLPPGLAPAPRHSPRPQAPGGAGWQQPLSSSSAGGGTAAAQNRGPGQHSDSAEAAESMSPAGVAPLPSMRPSRAPAGQLRGPGPYGSMAAPVPWQQAGTEEVQTEVEPSLGGNITAAAGPDRLGESWQQGPATRVQGGKDLDYRGGRAPLGEPAAALGQQPSSSDAGQAEGLVQQQEEAEAALSEGEEAAVPPMAATASGMHREFRPPQELQLPPEPSAEALLQQRSYPARTAAGQYWSAGGHLPREPFQVVSGNNSTGKAPECVLAKPRLGGTAKVMVQLQRLQAQEFDGTAALQQDTAAHHRVQAAAASAAVDVPAGHSLYGQLPPVEDGNVPTEAARLVPKQLHPAWLARRNLKPAMSDLWRPERQIKGVITTAKAQQHIKFDRRKLAEDAVLLDYL